MAGPKARAAAEAAESAKVEESKLEAARKRHGGMFYAVVRQRTSEGWAEPGDPMPVILTGQAAGAKALVDAGAIEWDPEPNGPQSEYGPFERGALALEAAAARGGAGKGRLISGGP